MNKIPVSTATKIRNHIIKNFNATVVPKYYSDSNPYETVQRLEARINERDYKKLGEVMVSEGWIQDYNDFKHPDERVWVTFYRYDGTGGAGEVYIYGPKKCKPRTIPYYD